MFGEDSLVKLITGSAKRGAGMGFGASVRRLTVTALRGGLLLALLFSPVVTTMTASSVASDYWQKRVISRTYGQEAWAAGLRITRQETLTDGRPADRSDRWALSAGILA